MSDEDREGFLPFDVTHTRGSDPETSWDAAQSTEPKVTKFQTRILAILDSIYPQGMTHEELTTQYRDLHGKCGDSSVRSRCKDLCEMGLVVDSGKRRQVRSGLMGIVWVAVRSETARSS